MRKLILAAFVALLTTACAAPVDWAATGGSKSDGVVRLSYEHSPYVKPETNDQQGIDLATKRCEAWGYSSAEAFGGHTRVCNAPSMGSCNSWLVTKEFQCVNE